MLKRACFLLNLILILIVISNAEAETGTFIVGVKCWYETTWDSALLDINDKYFNDMLDETDYYDIESDTYAGTGYLVGPVIGYQTRDKLWSFSFAPMLISKFSQEIRGSSVIDLNLEPIVGYALPMPVTASIKTKVDVTRRDYDLAASYSLHRFKDRSPLLEYCKVYFGLKYQDINYGVKLTTKLGSIEEDNDVIRFDYEVYMPTIGVGVTYPLTEAIVTGIQGGIGLTHFSGINADDALAYNLEANVSIFPFDRVIMQFGYRLQQFSFDLHPKGTDKTYYSTDKTYGPTLSFVYTL